MSSSRTCCISTSRCHSAGASCSIACGTMSAMMRAPWLPPITSSRSGPSGSGGAIGHRGGGQDRRTHRRAGGGGLRRQRRIAVEHAGQRGGDRGDVGGQEAVGAAHHRVGIVHQRRNPQQPRRDQRRQRRIAAEADHRGRLQPQHQVPAPSACRRRASAPVRASATGERPRTVSLGTTSIMSRENSPL